MFLHDAGHTGRSTATGAQSPEPKSGWPVDLVSTDPAGFVSGSPAVAADGMVYVVGKTGVEARAPNGRLRWKRTIGDPYLGNDKLWGTPALGSDGTVYVLGVGVEADGILYALAPNGRLKWQLETGRIGGATWNLPSPTIGRDGTVYVLNAGTTLHAVKPNGGVRWSFTFGDHANYAVPALGPDGTIYAAVFAKIGDYEYQNRLYALSAGGQVRWFVELAGDTESSPAVGPDGTIYVGSNANRDAGQLNAVSPEGRIRWKYDLGTRILSSPAIGRDGTIYVAGERGGVLYALRPDGSLRWRFRVSPCPTFGDVYVQSASPAIGGDGTVYLPFITCFQSGGALYAVAPNGKEKWHAQLRAAEMSPAIGPDGTLYIADISTTSAILRAFVGPNAKRSDAIDYFALGDSIASGHGLMDDQTACRRSKLAYPAVVQSVLDTRYERVDLHLKACSGATASKRAVGPKLLEYQVGQVLKRPSTRPTLVTITIGVNDLGWSNITQMMARLYLDTQIQFESYVLRAATNVRRELELQVERLVRRPRTVVVLTTYFNPVNRKSVFCGYLTGLPTRPCYGRTVYAVSRINHAIERVWQHFRATKRVAIVRLPQRFQDRESPRRSCGLAPPSAGETWVQYRTDPASNSNPLAERPGGVGYQLVYDALLRLGPWSGDCFHPNRSGARAIGQAVATAAIGMIG